MLIEAETRNKNFQEQATKLASYGETLGSIDVGTGGGFTVDPRTGQKKPSGKSAPQ